MKPLFKRLILRWDWKGERIHLLCVYVQHTLSLTLLSDITMIGSYYKNVEGEIQIE